MNKTPFIGFWFKNIRQENVIKFARIEDINWDELIIENNHGIH